ARLRPGVRSARRRDDAKKFVERERPQSASLREALGREIMAETDASEQPPTLRTAGPAAERRKQTETAEVPGALPTLSPAGQEELVKPSSARGPETLPEACHGEVSPRSTRTGSDDPGPLARTLNRPPSTAAPVESPREPS